MKTIHASFCACLIAASFAGSCAKLEDAPRSVEKLIQPSPGPQPQEVPRYDFKVSNLANTLVFDSANPSLSLQLKEGESYRFEIIPQSVGTVAYTYEYTTQQIDVIDATESSYSTDWSRLNSLTPGDYAIRIRARNGSNHYPARIFQARVACKSSALDPAAFANVSIIASQQSVQTFQYQLMGAVPGGLGVYTCSWDVNGDAIRDTPFAVCNTSPGPYFSNALNAANTPASSWREVTVLVKDKCNHVVPVTRRVNLVEPEFEPETATVTYLHGVTGYARDSAANPIHHKGASEVNYWGIMPGTETPGTGYKGVNLLFNHYFSAYGVTPGSGVGTGYIFGDITLDSTAYYPFTGKLTSNTDADKSFGMRLMLDPASIVINPGVTQALSTINTDHMRIKDLSYSTDDADDTLPWLKFSGSDCTRVASGGQFTTVTPTSCGPAGSDMMSDWIDASGNYIRLEWRFRIWGRYTCNLHSATGATLPVDLEFAFDGTEGSYCYRKPTPPSPTPSPTVTSTPTPTPTVTVTPSPSPKPSPSPSPPPAQF